MLEVESGLIRQKEEFALKIESLTQRREELVRKEAQLKESLFKFDKFLRVRINKHRIVLPNFLINSTNLRKMMQKECVL